MGTTLTAMQAGSVAYVYVVAIEGYQYLLTNGSPAAAVTAWSGSDWTLALPGLYVELDNEQSLDPWQPFRPGGGACTLKVQPDPTDQFGTDLNRTLATPESQITATVNRSATTISVQSTTGFASAGEAFLGNECFFYSSKSSTVFTVGQRGRYSPFPAGTAGATVWGEHHRAGFIDSTTPVHPLVTAYRRTWVGAWVGVWAHRVVNGVLDTKANAQLVYAGQIADHVDDAATGYAVLHLTHLLDIIRDTTLLRDQFTATLKDGVYLKAGLYCYWYENINGNIKTSAQFTVMASGATGTAQINAGYYNADQILAAFQVWLAGELAAARLTGQYTLAVDHTNVIFSEFNATSARIAVTWAFPLSAGVVEQVNYSFRMSHTIAAFLGLEDIAFIGAPGDYSHPSIPAQTGAQPNNETLLDAVPWRVLFGSQYETLPTQMGTQAGTLFDNWALLPAQWKAQLPGGPFGYQMGVFLVNNSNIMLGFISGSTLALTWILTTNTDLSLRYGDVGTITITQIAAIETTWAPLLLQIFRSSGTAGYNDATSDTLAHGLGISVPGSLMPDPAFGASITGQDGAGLTSTLWIRKPTKIAELLTVDLVLRGIHLVFKNGALTFTQWHTPTALDVGLVTLDETNKAEPAGNRSNQRSATVLSTDWAHPIASLKFDYDPIGDTFRSTIGLEDAVAIDDGNGITDPVKLECRTLSAAGVNALLPSFVSRWIPAMSRPLRKLTRSVDPRYYVAISPGDGALVSDKFARDPLTGVRGIAAAPAIIARHRANPGGPQAGQPASKTPPQGEVDLVFVPGGARTAQYSPAAEVDSTAGTSGFSAGYNSGTLTLRCLPHEHTPAGGHDVDYFAAAGGDKIRIIEVDPDDPAAPLTWTRTTASHAGDDIVITVALSSPAWDATKRYRIVPDHFAVCQTSQQIKAFEADATTALVESSTVAFQYALAAPQGFTNISHTALAEHHAALGDGDGKPRDTGYDAALARTINNLVDHKTAHQSPWLDQYERSNSSAGYKLMWMRKIFVGTGTLGLVGRALAVAPMFRSTTGATVHVRATLSSSRTASNTYTGVAFSGPFVQQTWATSSTTYVTGAEATLDLSVAAYGWAWLMVEIDQNCAARGLAQCIERERT